MDGFGKDHTSSTSIEPNSPFQGNDVKKLSEEMDFKLKRAHERRLAIKHFMATTTSSASKTSVPKGGKSAERNNPQTLDVEERQHCLPRSYSFDSKYSLMAVDPDDDINNNLLQPYDPINNYLSPRPRFLKYNPDRHREIYDRQKNVNRVIKRSASYDCSLGDSFREESIEETDIIAPELEYGEEKEQVFDDFEEGSGWNSKVLVQYLSVIIVLILTTITITSMNSQNLSPVRESIRGFVNLYHKSYSSVFETAGFDFLEVGELSKREFDYNYDEIGAKDVGDDNMEGYKTEEIEEVQNYKIDEIQDSHTKENIEEKEEMSYELHEQVILTSDEIYSDFDRGHQVSEELETLEMMVDDDDDGKEDGNNIGMDENILIKLARYDCFFAAFIGVCLFILGTLSIIYYSKKSKTTISSPLTYKTIHSGSLIESDAISSSEAKSSYLEFSTDSPSYSYGSFTVEKKIVKKKKSKKPEVMVSPVRRSSRIHNRSITSP